MMLKRNVLHPSSGFMNKSGKQVASRALWNVSNSVPDTQRHISEDSNFCSHHDENFKFCVYIPICLFLLQAKYPLALCGDLRFADRKTRSFKAYLFEFSQAKLCYYKDKRVSIPKNLRKLRNNLAILHIRSVDGGYVLYSSLMLTPGCHEFCYATGFHKAGWMENWRHCVVLGIWAKKKSSDEVCTLLLERCEFCKWYKTMFFNTSKLMKPLIKN